MSSKLKALLLNANSTSNTSIIGLLMASLMANGLDVGEVHQTLQKYRGEIWGFDDSLPEILKVPFYHTSFMLDHMEMKAGEAYSFFFDPKDLSIEKLLEMTDNGYQALQHGINENLYSAEELVMFYSEVKKLLDVFNQDIEEKESMYIAVLAILIGAQKNASGE